MNSGFIFLPVETCAFIISGWWGLQPYFISQLSPGHGSNEHTMWGALRSTHMKLCAPEVTHPGPRWPPGLWGTNPVSPASAKPCTGPRAEGGGWLSLPFCMWVWGAQTSRLKGVFHQYFDKCWLLRCIFNVVATAGLASFCLFSWRGFWFALFWFHSMGLFVGSSKPLIRHWENPDLLQILSPVLCPLLWNFWLSPTSRRVPMPPSAALGPHPPCYTVGLHSSISPLTDVLPTVHLGKSRLQSEFPDLLD